MMDGLRNVFLCLVCTGIARGVLASASGLTQAGSAPKGAPNIVLILLDDVGFGAASTFGGPAETPQLDELASRGLRYNHFHVSALCSPTRAALLSGRNDHRAGFGITTEVVSGYLGYTGVWRKDTVMVADVLRRNGYSTAAFGKWHNTPYREINPVGPFDRWPTGLGFEYFYGFMAGADSQWEPSLYRNTTPVETRATPEHGYHLTADLADQAIQWLHTHESLAPHKPYFLYFATGATHKPHHVPEEWIEKYRGRFDQGWDKLREETFARQKARGVVPRDAELTPRPKELPAWDSLSADERRLLARQMEVYAAFLAHTDYEVGRLIKAVQQGPQGDNTLILYVVGDNGADGKAGVHGHDLPGDATGVAGLTERLQHIDDLGTERFLNEYAAGWAWAMSTPFQWMKKVASHFGGIRAPLIVFWPDGIKDRGGLRTQFTHVNDVAATVYDVTGVPFPAVVDGVKQQPLDGASFAYSFPDPTAPSRHRIQIFEQVGNRAMYRDGWVAAARHSVPWVASSNDREDFEKDRWELYHIDTDFSQAHDLAARYPQKLKELQALFDTEARKNNIYPLGAGWKVAETQQASPAAGRRQFVFYPHLPRTPGLTVMSGLPNFSQSHRITADLVVPAEGANGVIVAHGSRYGGFVLYIKDNHLVYETKSGSVHKLLTSSVLLPKGEVSVGYEFVSNGQGARKGLGRLYIDGKNVGEEAMPRAEEWDSYWGSFGVGQAFGSSLSSAFQLPFKFSGTLEKVTVILQ